MKDFETQQLVKILNQFRNDLRQVCLDHGFDEDSTSEFVSRAIEFTATDHPSQFIREQTSIALASENNNEV